MSNRSKQTALFRLSRIVAGYRKSIMVVNRHGQRRFQGQARRARAARLLSYWAERCRDECPECGGDGLHYAYGAEIGDRCPFCNGTGIAGWGRR